MSQPDKPQWPDSLALDRVASMAEAEEFTSLSKDTLKRRYPDLIEQLSPRRRGMRVRNLIKIANQRASPP